MKGSSEGAPDVNETSKRYRITPQVVAGALVPDPTGGADHSAFALILSVDVDAVPGFQEVIDRQRNGEEFDIISRWGVAMDGDGEHPPLALIDFYLPDFELGIEIGINVDEHPGSILAAIQTGHVAILDTQSYERLQMEDEAGRYLDEIRAFSVSPSDPTLLIGVLQQRFDLPLDKYKPEWMELTDENRESAIAMFLADARLVDGIGISVRGDGPAMIILADSDADTLKGKVSPGATLEGRWGALIGDQRSLVSFDLFADGELIARWVFAGLSEEVLRAGSNGGHFVAIVAELDTGDAEAFKARMSEAMIASVPHVEVLRSLRFGGEPTSK
jgi:hypothetical protein